MEVRLTSAIGVVVAVAAFGACAPTDEDSSQQVKVGPRWPQALEQFRAAKNLPPMPEEEPRALVPRAEEMDYDIQCAREQGYEVKTVEGGGFSIPVSSLEESNRQAYECFARYPLRSDLISPTLSEEQLQVHYEWTINKIIPCITDLSLPVAEPPTFEEFAATYRNDQPLWFPGDYSGDELEQVRSACDLLPSWEDLGLVDE